MKKAIISLISALIISATALAEDYNLYLEPTSGSVTSWSVSNLQKMTFENSNVVLTMTDGTYTSTAISSISRMYFATNDANIINSVENDVEYKWDGTYLRFNPSTTNIDYTVISANGIQILTGNTASGSVISLSTLDKGFYIVTANKRQIKIMK